MRCRITMVVALVMMGSGVRGAERGDFQVIGIGGGGAMFTPVVYPGDSDVMFVTCDMGGVYRSSDGGKTWGLLHFKQLHTALNARPAFTREAMYWASGNELKVSRDKGVTWASVTGGSEPWEGEAITHLAAAGGGAVVGTGKGVWASDDGKAWRRAGDERCTGLAAVGGTVYLTMQGADGRKQNVLQVSGDVGRTWREAKVEGARGERITALAGTISAGGAGVARYVLMMTVENVGVLRSVNGGGSWQRVMAWDSQGDVLMPPGQDQVAYVCQWPRGRQVWRTGDGGRTWQSIFHMDFGDRGNVEMSWLQTYLRWDYTVTHYGMGIDPNDVNTAMITTEGELYVTRDAGKSWRPQINREVRTEADARGWAFVGTGLEVTVSCGYGFDPSDANRQYILYEDIGLARSVDAGRSWIPATRDSPWGNSFYQVAFDPFVKGRMYAACSSRHDIPAWLHVTANTPAQKGGVCVSDDYAATWRVLNKDLPQLPCTSLVIDPKSTAERLTMYAGFFEGGVYKTTDGGRTWAKKSAGLGNVGNLHVWKVLVHPRSGSLYCVITAFRQGRDFPVPGGVWKSTDGGESWRDLTAELKLAWPSGFAVSPADEGVMYLVGGTTPAQPQGGLYKTTDGGKTWKRVVSDQDLAKWCGPSYSNYGCVVLHPDDPRIVYFGTESHGLWVSQDAGAMWRVFEEIPFRGVTDVTFDPRDHKTMYVSTYGVSVLKGYYLPADAGK